MVLAPLTCLCTFQLKYATHDNVLQDLSCPHALETGAQLKVWQGHRYGQRMRHAHGLPYQIRHALHRVLKLVRKDCGEVLHVHVGGGDCQLVGNPNRTIGRHQ